MKWVLDPATGELLEAADYGRRLAGRRGRCRTGSLYVIGDWRPDEAVVSPVDGSLLTSRADVRAHNARHGVVDVGSDPAAAPGRMPKARREPAGEVIAAVMDGSIPARGPVGSVGPEEVSWTS